MTPPPIRYPLLTLLLLMVLGLIAWRGGDVMDAVRAELFVRWTRFRERPTIAFPSSMEPMVLEGMIHERVLVLEEETSYASEPGGDVIGSIRYRSFADCYDRWPVDGKATHLRIGNRRPFGWVAMDRLIAWSTRIVLMPSSDPTVIVTEGGEPFGPQTEPIPVLIQNPKQLHVHAWGESGPWHPGGSSATLQAETVPGQDWGVWLTRSELLTLLGRDQNLAPVPVAPFGRPTAVIKAMLGLPINDRPLTTSETEIALRLLGPAATMPPKTDRMDALARINEQWKPDATWGGVEYRAVRLNDIP